MYCINCGVKLEDTEKRCPLCGVEVFHPDLVRGEAEPLYPPNKYPEPETGSRTGKIVITTLTLMAVILMLMCDIQINRKIIWSGYAVGGLLTAYTAIVLPMWFRKPEPGVFMPVTFVVIALFLMYINKKTGGNWFFSFALPITVCMCVIATALTMLLRFLRKGRLYIFGGTAVVLGLFVMLVESLLSVTFSNVYFVGWSLYPAVALVLLGAMLVILAVHRPARETMERKFFI